MSKLVPVFLNVANEVADPKNLRVVLPLIPLILLSVFIIAAIVQSLALVLLPVAALLVPILQINKKTELSTVKKALFIFSYTFVFTITAIPYGFFVPFYLVLQLLHSIFLYIPLVIFAIPIQVRTTRT